LLIPNESIADLILQASPFVQGVMALLVLISGISWWAIVRKYRSLSRAFAEANHFEDDFWSGADLSSLYSQIRRRNEPIYGMEAIFVAGFQEFLRLQSQSQIDVETAIKAPQRAMRAALSREIDDLETYLPMLATAGSVSPYIGLLGTVWGIMSSFIAIGGSGQATLTQVAPGIAEALIATAMGLIAAIPAVMAYNRYANQVDRLISRYDTFMEEFTNILQRQSYNLRSNPTNSRV
jgi:biopolymer transport protein TolQ